MNDHLEKLSELRRRIQVSERMVALKRQLSPHHSPAEARQSVVNGRISRDPINKQAAMITAKQTCWLHHPDAVQPERKPPMSTKPEAVALHEYDHPMKLMQQGHVHDKSNDEMNTELGAEMVRRKDRLNDTSIHLALRVLEARETLDWSCNHIKKSWCDWMDDAEKALKDVRMLRQAISTESAQLMAACKDVRKFFLERDYAEEMSRLKEFVAVCERLEAMHKRGTLDAVADVILKLAK